MISKAVFVETNWIVDFIAPAHLQEPDTARLLQRAKSGEFTLYAPSICLAEARETIPRRFAPKVRSDGMRKFVRWAKSTGKITDSDARATYTVLDQFDSLVGGELETVSNRLAELRSQPGLTIFPLSEQMLEYNCELGSMGLSIKPYDLAILASILIKAKEIYREGNPEIYFYEQDSDLKPWDRKGNVSGSKADLAKLYDAANIQVFDDLLSLLN